MHCAYYPSSSWLPYPPQPCYMAPNYNSQPTSVSCSSIDLHDCNAQSSESLSGTTSDDILKKYPSLRGDAKMGRLAVALARECYFGKEIMKISSVGGKGPGTRPLPSKEMEDIRSAIFSLCPHYHSNLVEFENIIWSKCKTAINHACNKYRL